MTRRDYTTLQVRRDLIAAEIRHALSHDRTGLARLYAEARRLAMESLRAEAAA